jgi:hypothetical protein
MYINEAKRQIRTSPSVQGRAADDRSTDAGRLRRQFYQGRRTLGSSVHFRRLAARYGALGIGYIGLASFMSSRHMYSGGAEGSVRYPVWP